MTDPTADSPEQLALIPRDVRDKLDRVGIKLHLKEWELMTIAERAHLRELPCASADEIARYGAEVDGLVQHYTGKAAERLKP